MAKNELEGIRVHESKSDFTTTVTNTNSGFSGLCVEWVKSRAHAYHAYKEVKLVEEEMQRALAFGEWKEARWMKHTEKQQVSCPHFLEGRRVYAFQQSSFEKQCHALWVAKWAPVHERAAAVLLKLESANGGQSRSSRYPMRWKKRWQSQSGAWID